MATRAVSIFQLFTPMPVGDRIHVDLTPTFDTRREAMRRARSIRSTVGPDIGVYLLRIQNGAVAEARLITSEDLASTAKTKE